MQRRFHQIRAGVMLTKRSWLAALAIFLLTGPAPLIAWAASHQIVQKGRAFDAADMTVAAGDDLLFTNEDPFLHQIYVKSPTMNFEIERAAARSNGRCSLSHSRHYHGSLPHPPDDVAHRYREIAGVPARNAPLILIGP